MFRAFFSIIFFFFFYSYSQDYDVTYYDLQIDVDVDNKFISGSNQIFLKSINLSDSIKVDLFDNFIVDSVFFLDKKRHFRHHNNVITIYFNELLKNQEDYFLKIFYQGNPILAKNPPWNGGFVWKEDQNKNPWVGVACQGDGASIWWPNHDVLYDEPDSMQVSLIVPNHLKAISNGNLIAQYDTIVNESKKSIFVWKILHPINNYNVTLNIADYRNFVDTLNGEKGFLNLDYFVLKDDYLIAKEHFNQVKPMLHFFEKKFGPYPFYIDGYCLVQTPYLGMEHQSCIAYGNEFKKGYLGYYPGEIDFDFIIIHETAHEWWGNNLSMGDKSDMWIHESFATYAEALYVEEMYGYDDMILYLNDQRKRIKNKIPIKSDLFSSTDMYYKGSWVLHTLRTCFKNDLIWDHVLRGLQLEFKHQIVTTNDIIGYIESFYGYDLTAFFEQYLFQSALPIFEYFINKKKNKSFLKFRWNAVSGFDMPLLAIVNKKDYQWIYPNEHWKEIELVDIKENDFQIAEDLFLIDVNRLK